MESYKNYLDTARAVLMLLGIPLHASMIYGDGAQWMISSPEKSYFIGMLGVAIHSFRMHAFFAIAGYFSLVLIRRRGTSSWLRSRLTRIGVPLLAATFLLNPIQGF